MLVVLIPIAFTLVWLVAYQHARDGRLAALMSWTALGAVVVATNELLSPFRAITSTWIALAWILVIAFTAVPLVKRWRSGTLTLPHRPQFTPTWIEGALILVAGVAVLCAFISGICSPPNNWDSMTYKLPRVHYWIQHQSLRPFPTHITRQVELGPGAGYWLLHLQLLSQSFRWFFAVQFVAGITASIAASLLVRDFGGNRTAQIIGACLVWSAPMAILQASSTQDDLTAGCWVMTFIVFALRLMRAANARAMNAWGLLAGCALGVGLVTKGTVYVFAFPFCLWVAVRWLRAPSRPMFRALVLLSLPVFAANFPFLSRNMATFGHPFGGPQRIWISNARHGPDVVYQNVVRNLVVNFAGLDHKYNKHMERRTEAAIRLIGLDIDDPETTFPSGFFDLKHRFEKPGWLWHEDWAPNPGSTAATILATFVVAVLFRDDRRWFAIATLGSGIFFCWAFRYQPWVTRLQLPFLTLGAVAMALLWERWPRSMCSIALVLLLAASPAGPLNFLRPIVGRNSVLWEERDAILFAHRPHWRAQFESLHKRLIELKPTHVGIVDDKESWEWAVMYYFRAKRDGTPWFGHPFVTQETSQYERQDPWKTVQYDAIILLDPQWYEEPKGLRRDHVKDFHEGTVALWRRAKESTTSHAKP